MTMKTTILVAGMCALAGTTFVATARAQETIETKQTATGMKEERQRPIMGTIESIDKDNRMVTLTDDQGNKKTVAVPTSLKGFDRLKVGDKVNVTYSESIAVGIGKPGEKPSVVTREGAETGPGHSGAAMKQIQATAEVMGVDAKKHKVTFKKPDGTVQTVTVDDPSLREKLSSVKPGDSIEVVYTEAVAGTITPAKK
jgi:Cu/Ag efflux protein CusF